MSSGSVIKEEGRGNGHQIQLLQFSPSTSTGLIQSSLGRKMVFREEEIDKKHKEENAAYSKLGNNRGSALRVFEYTDRPIYIPPC